jgi:CBS domain-containing protein
VLASEAVSWNTSRIDLLSCLREAWPDMGARFPSMPKIVTLFSDAPCSRILGSEAMNVTTILSTKGSDVATIAPTATVAEAAQVMSDRKIGALVITGAGSRITGIVSERDIVRALAKHGAGALQLPLNDVMTRKVVTCGPGDSVANLMEQMTDGKFRHLPVVDSDKLAGIISIGDVVKSRLAELELEQSALRDYIQTA